MELDDLKQSWEQYDRKLGASVQLNASLLRSSTLDKTETALKRLSRMLWTELVLTLAAALWLGSFLWEHGSDARFLVPAAILHLGVIVLAIACVRQITAIARIDYGAPVLAIQRRLEGLRASRIRATKWTLLLAPLLWTPLFIVAIQGFFGMDAYATFDTAWLVANVLFGLLVAAAVLWVSRTYADRLERSPFLQRLARDVAGKNLVAATGFLRLLEQFEEEESGANLLERSI